MGAASSFSTKNSGHSDGATSECSSLAPYWIPEEIKHYFLHRHSASEEDDSSHKVDLALRAIGRERELPAIDDSDWSRGKCCRKPRHPDRRGHGGGHGHSARPGDRRSRDQIPRRAEGIRTAGVCR
ncbi:uncharacterized protein LOC125940910 [Dermacentor silvarum]|uniref:uncharacterized protein LOC125940910 n=1 Tax=Dermacentor silvarum TaxID=543639 RepID=UPI002101A138|nr:uncharacterized protein LOC125940910 [Dermacentor silvarum]